MKNAAIFSAALLCAVVFAGSVHAQHVYTGPGDPPQLELLFMAASAGDLQTLNRLLSQNPDLAKQASSKDGRTALHVAVMTGKIKAAEILLNHGADPNARDYHCRTPYYYAKVSYRDQIARLLYKRGAKRERVRFFPHCCTQMPANPAWRKPSRVCKP